MFSHSHSHTQQLMAITHTRQQGTSHYNAWTGPVAPRTRSRLTDRLPRRNRSASKMLIHVIIELASSGSCIGPIDIRLSCFHVSGLQTAWETVWLSNHPVPTSAFKRNCGKCVYKPIVTRQRERRSVGTNRLGRTRSITPHCPL